MFNLVILKRLSLEGETTGARPGQGFKKGLCSQIIRLSVAVWSLPRNIKASETCSYHLWSSPKTHTLPACILALHRQFLLIIKKNRIDEIKPSRRNMFEDLFWTSRWCLTCHASALSRRGDGLSLSKPGLGGSSLPSAPGQDWWLWKSYLRRRSKSDKIHTPQRFNSFISRLLDMNHDPSPAYLFDLWLTNGTGTLWGFSLLDKNGKFKKITMAKRSIPFFF